MVHDAIAYAPYVIRRTAVYRYPPYDDMRDTRYVIRRTSAYTSYDRTLSAVRPYLDAHHTGIKLQDLTRSVPPCQRVDSRCLFSRNRIAGRVGRISAASSAKPNPPMPPMVVQSSSPCRCRVPFRRIGVVDGGAKTAPYPPYVIRRKAVPRCPPYRDQISRPDPLRILKKPPKYKTTKYISILYLFSKKRKAINTI